MWLTLQNMNIFFINYPQLITWYFVLSSFNPSIQCTGVSHFVPMGVMRSSILVIAYPVSGIFINLHALLLATDQDIFWLGTFDAIFRIPQAINFQLFGFFVQMQVLFSSQFELNNIHQVWRACKLPQIYFTSHGQTGIL